MTQHTIDIRDSIDRLIRHPLYRSIDTEAALRHFMRAHVFCVWDFQSLLTALRRSMSCTTVPWLPRGDPEGRRLVNEIVLEEESDEMADGSYLSHYELYVRGMADAGADSGPVEALIERLREGAPVNDAIAASELPAGTRDFIQLTFDIIASGDLHRVVAAFTYGREDIIPDMFTQLVRQLADEAPERWGRFLWYLDRHIEADGERHGPISHRLLARTCGDDAEKWAEAGETARAVVEARIALWDEILRGMPRRQVA
ncbi:MAG: DUF3050 domain-containing protein [Gammaproteobacteria bacterium]